MQIRDTTKVTAVEPGRRLDLDACLWPTGAARVWLSLTPIGADHTRVTMGELLDRGPASLMPTAVQGASLRALHTTDTAIEAGYRPCQHCRLARVGRF